MDPNAAFEISLSDSGEFAGAISGKGDLVVSGGEASTISLTARNTYTGETRIESGTLQIDGIEKIGRTSKVVFGAGETALEIDQKDGGTFKSGLASAEAGAGRIVKKGSGKITIDADNGAFSGAFNLENGSVVAKNANALGTGEVSLAEKKTITYELDTAGESKNSFAGSGEIVKTGDGALSLSGDSSEFSGKITISSGRVVAGNANALGTGEVANSGTLVLDIADGAFAGTVLNTISGAGNLEKTGSGEVVVSGANSYTGRTTVSEGTLTVKGVSALAGGKGMVEVKENAKLKFTAAPQAEPARMASAVAPRWVDVAPSEFGGRITGAGSVDVSDFFGLVLNSANTFRGGMSISNSTVVSRRGETTEGIGSGDVSLVNSMLSVSNGFRAISGRKITLSNSQILAEADGGFSAKGDLVLDSIGLSSDGSALEFEVSNREDVKKTRISGKGKIELDGINLEISGNSTIFDRAGEIAFIELSDDLAVSGDVADIYINGDLVEYVYDVRTGKLTLDTVSSSMNLGYAAMVVMPTEMFNKDVGNIRGRLDQRRFETAAAQEWEFYAQARSTNVSNGNDKSDSATFDYSTFGALAGADIRLGESTLVGVALGYDHGTADIHDSEGKIDMDNYRLTVYASSVFAERIFADAGAQFGVGSYDIERKSSLYGYNKASADGWNAGAFATVGTVLTVSEEHRVFATPYVGLTYMHSAVDSIDETGTRSQSADSFSADSLRARLGVNTSWLFDLGEYASRLSLDVAYSHEFLDDELDVDMRSVGSGHDSAKTLTEKCFPEDMISIGANIDISLMESASVYFGYSADIGFNSDVAHNVNAGVRFMF